MNKTTATKLVTRAGPDHRLFVKRHDGETWATNSYWLAPARWFDVVLPARHGADDWADGTYNVKTVEMLHDDCPNIGALLPTEPGDELKPAQYAGRDVIVGNPNGDLCIFTMGDVDIAIRRDFLEMFRTAISGELILCSSGASRPVEVYQVSSITYANPPRTEKARKLAGLIMPVRIS